MGSALSSVGGPPPAPNPQPQQTTQNPLAAVGRPMAPSAPGSPDNPQAQQQSPIPPSHAQTVAALRHFTAIENTTQKLLKNPDCGKADMRSAIIDGMTTLVSRGIIAPTDAVKELGSVPDKPFDQKKWLEQHFVQATQAQTAMLALHQHGAMNGMVSDQTAPSPDDHQAAMSGLASQLKASGNG